MNWNYLMFECWMAWSYCIATCVTLSSFIEYDDEWQLSGRTWPTSCFSSIQMLSIWVIVSIRSRTIYHTRTPDDTKLSTPSYNKTWRNVAQSSTRHLMYEIEEMVNIDFPWHSRNIMWLFSCFIGNITLLKL